MSDSLNHCKKATLGGVIISTALIIIFAVLYILPPLFHLNLKPNGLAPGFLSLRMINADLKFQVVVGCMSLIVGIVLVRIHLSGKCRIFSKSFLIFSGIL